MDPQVKEFLKNNKEMIGKIVCFGTSAGMKSMLKPLRKVADPLNIKVSDDEFHCRGKFGIMHKDRPNTEDLNAIKTFAKSICGK